jgi:hypothetical protein
MTGIPQNKNNAEKMTCQSKWKKMRFCLRVPSTVAFILSTYAIVFLICTLEQWLDLS